MSVWRVASSALPVLLLGACHLAPPPPAVAVDDVQLYVETAERGGRAWRLPQSGVVVTTQPQPIVNAAGISEIRVVPIDLGPALVITLSAASAKSLAARVGHEPKRLLLVSHDRALGIARIDGETGFTQVSMFVEMPVTDLTAWAQSMESRLRDRDQGRRE